jgi:hypothetical protein
MNIKHHHIRDESELALDRAIRAAMAEPTPEEVKNRVIQTALGFAGGEPNVPRNLFLERMLNMVQTHKRLSVASAAAVAALAAGVALSISLVSPSGRAYALEETAQANNHVTSYHVKITPAVSLGEAWVQLNPDGTPLQARMDFQLLLDGTKVVIHSKGKAEVWVKNKNNLLIIPEADALQRISEMRNLADPKLAFERLQAEKAAGKVEIATKRPAKDGEPIVLTVTFKMNPDRRQVYEINPKAKLVERVTSYRLTGEKWEQVALRQYLDYNQPIDPKVFQPEMPKDVSVFDQIARKPGLVKGDLTEDEIAKKVVREFFEALIAGDYDKAGVIYEAMPGKKLKESLGETKFVRIIEIGKPTQPNALMRALQAPSKSLRVPAKVEIEIKGRREVKDWSPFVRPPYGQPDRRVIHGGI